jgi:hypothetical protein
LIPLERALAPSDAAHVRKVLQGDDPKAEARAMSTQVREFLRDHTFVDRGSRGAFRALARERRERLLSELVWRITCHLDGSITRVVGVDVYDLGSGFQAVKSETEGQDIFLVTAGSR